MQNYKRLEQASSLINQSQTIYIYSGGKHIHLANYFKNKMLEIGKHVEVIQRFDLVFYHVEYASNKDCLVLISYSGETNDISRILEGTKQKDLPILALTSFGANTLSNSADITLTISTREKLTNNSGNFSSDLSVLYLLDVLFASCFAKDFEHRYTQKNKIAKSYQTFRHSANPLIND